MWAQHLDAFVEWRHTSFGVVVQLRGTSHTARLFFLPAHFVWHGFLQSEQKLVLALVRELMVSPHTMHFTLTLGAMESDLKLQT